MEHHRAGQLPQAEALYRQIFDVTGQRDKAVNEYRLAVQTNHNTQGAANEARLHLQKPYTRPEGE